MTARRDPADVGLALLREPDAIDTCDMETGHGPCILPGTHTGACLPAPVRHYRNSDFQAALRRAS